MTENTTVNIETEKDHTMIPVKKQAKDLVWSNVNFSVGEKSILKDCWGEVSFRACVNSLFDYFTCELNR